MRLLVGAAIAGAALAFQNTSPAVLWSSKKSQSIDSLPSQFDATVDIVSFLQDILVKDAICEYDAVVFVEHEGLQATDLRSLTPHGYLFDALQRAPSSKQYPYIPHYPYLGFHTFMSNLSTKCRSHLTTFRLGDDSKPTFQHGTSHVVHLVMPSIMECGRLRKDSMTKHASKLGVELSILMDSFSNHLVILIGSPVAINTNLFKRQAASNLEQPSLDLLTGEPTAPTYTNTTLPVGGILKKYQLLTSELIVSLLVFLFIILPFALFGIKALASVQNPIRTDITKTALSLERKNQ